MSSPRPSRSNWSRTNCRAPTPSPVHDLDYNVRGQLEKTERGEDDETYPPDTTYLYYNGSGGFRLDEIQHGTTGDAIPDFLYNQYDNLGQLEIVQMRQSGVTETQTFTYDAVGRLTSAVGTGAAVYDYAYTYDPGGNIATRVNRTPNPDLTRTYHYSAQHAHAVESISGSMTAAYIYDDNGNMTNRTDNLGTFTQAFDAENRLTSVLVGGQTTSFYYDADGNRILTVQPNGTKVYTPFPEYEESVPPSGATTQRSSYYVAGQLIAVRVRTGTTGNGTLYFAYADHLGNVSAWTNTSGALVSGSLARYDPYGVYRTKPASTVNPDISDRGFTGHRMNNTGTYDLGLIYMNARYYLPEIGRFVSADSIVPDPANPQSYNRYSYSYNNPIQYTDPSGYDPLDAAWEEAFCNEHFGGMSGCLITDEDRRDRLFSVIFPGSGANGAWTAADWAFYSANKTALWAGNLLWLDGLTLGLDRFLSHLDRLAGYYNPGEEGAFVEAVGNVWGGIPFGPPLRSAVQAVNGPVLSVLHEGNANWVPNLVEAGQDATHHYAGLFYSGYFFGAGPAAAINWFRDGPRSDNNPPDLHLGYVAGLQGNMLARGFISPSEVSTVARFALDVRLDTWYEPTRWSDYRNYWFKPYSGQ